MLAKIARATTASSKITALIFCFLNAFKFFHFLDIIDNESLLYWSEIQP